MTNDIEIEYDAEADYKKRKAKNEAGLNYAGKSPLTRTRVFEVEIDDREYQMIRVAAMYGRFSSWNFNREIETGIMRVNAMDLNEVQVKMQEILGEDSVTCLYLKEIV